MTAVLLTPPAVEPVLIAEARAYLRLNNTDDDDLVSALISAARIHVERLTRQVLIQQEWRCFFDAWPEDNVIKLPITPVQAVLSISIHDENDKIVKLHEGDYRLDAYFSPPRIVTAHGAYKPSKLFNGIEIDITAGYGTSGVEVPQPLRLAIMMLATRWYEGRDGAFVSAVPSDITDSFNALVAPYRMLKL